MHDTTLSGNSRNRHPVDRLADVRANLRALQEEEAELKDRIGRLMGSADSLGGDQFIAIQRLQERKGGLDEAAMKAAGIDPDQYRKPSSTFVVLKVEPRVSEVA